MVSNKGRVCTNCKAVYNTNNVTICLKCGHVTREKVVTKGVDIENSMGGELRPDRERPGIQHTSKEFKKVT